MTGTEPRDELARRAGSTRSGATRCCRRCSSTSPSRTCRPPSTPSGRRTATSTGPSSCCGRGPRSGGLRARPSRCSSIAGRTPLLVVEVPATPGCTSDETVLLYGHLDKQPAMDGWHDGLGPWTAGGRRRPALRAGRGRRRVRAVRRADRHRGRRGVRAATTPAAWCSSRPARRAAAPTSRPTSTRSATGSGRSGLVVALDSSSPSYDRLWLTTSLRGLIEADLGSRCCSEGQHSGIAGGAVPSTFRIARPAARPGRGLGDGPHPAAGAAGRGAVASGRTRSPTRPASSASTRSGGSRTSTGPGPPRTTRPRSCGRSRGSRPSR